MTPSNEDLFRSTPINALITDQQCDSAPPTFEVPNYEATPHLMPNISAAPDDEMYNSSLAALGCLRLNKKKMGL